MKAPGEFTTADMLGLALSGSAGIIAALVTDYQQSGEASALYTINQWVAQVGSILGVSEIPLWMVVIGMTMVGAGSIFYFQPITRQAAFAQGFGLLAVLMTAVPANLAGGLESMGDNLPGLESIAYGEGRVYQASYAGEYIQVQSQRAAKYDCTLVINFPNGLPESMDTMLRKGTLRGRMHNADTGETFNLFRNAGGMVQKQGDSLIIRAGIPARSQNATIWVRVEADKYAIQEASTQASLGTPLNWTVNMEPSSTPLFMQRLNKSYWF
ncbi:MAG: hypothetical protein KAH44_04720 [Oricola sp.]|nr:hypothetical protein [Oricola sp.]